MSRISAARKCMLEKNIGPRMYAMSCAIASLGLSSSLKIQRYPRNYVKEKEKKLGPKSY